MGKHKFFREGFPPSAGPGAASLFNAANAFDLDLNSASLDALSRIPLIGPERAQAVIDGRPFTHWRQVAHLPDFTDEIVEELKKGGARIAREPAA
jgi:predicted DNA-binding helix-hairpin-helix protein